MKKKKVVKGLEKSQPYRVKIGTLVNPKNLVEGTSFINASDPRKLDIDIIILGDEYPYEYLSQISYNTNMPLNELENLLKNYDSDTIKKRFEYLKSLMDKKDSLEISKENFIDEKEKQNIEEYAKTLQERIDKINTNQNLDFERKPIIYRISLPFWRLHENCYCGDIYISKEDFFKGVLIFNNNFGKFNVNILPQHRFLIEDYYNRFIKMLTRIQMNDRDFFFACPEEGNRAQNIGYFCESCLVSKYKRSIKTISKAKYYYKQNPKKREVANITIKHLQIRHKKQYKNKFNEGGF